MNPPEFLKKLIVGEQHIDELIASVRVELSQQVRQDHIRCSSMDMSDGYYFVSMLEDLQNALKSGWKASDPDVEQKDTP